MSESVIVKVCTCCDRNFTAYDWKLLDFRGYFMDDAPAIPGEPEHGEPQGKCELRNCDCGTTLMVPCSKLENKQ